MSDCEHEHTVHVAVYDQWYCTDCNSYMPRGWLPEQIECPYCHDYDTRYIERYDRYFCNECNLYLPEGYGPPRNNNQNEENEENGDYSTGDSAGTDPAGTDPAGTETIAPAKDKCCYCYGPLLYIAELKQYRCDHCEAYMPKDYGNPNADAATTTYECPYCGGTNIVEIPRYHQFFCRDCNTYLPKGTNYQTAAGGDAPVEDAVPGPFVLDASNRITLAGDIHGSFLHLNGCAR
ncbi:MAG: hypothetical protein QGH39_03490 [Candidatus Thermoplasmatota archaeon]|jgi:hypothetical protein|nr:hypothetical protein [Candidatus Thermoplasmatota archaeon]